MATTILTKNRNAVLSLSSVLTVCYRNVTKKSPSFIDILYRYMIKYDRIMRNSMRLELVVLRNNTQYISVKFVE